MDWVKIITWAALAAFVVFALIKVLIILVKVVSFLLLVALFIVPIAAIYFTVKVLTDKKNK